MGWIRSKLNKFGDWSDKQGFDREDRKTAAIIGAGLATGGVVAAAAGVGVNEWVKSGKKKRDAQKDAAKGNKKVATSNQTKADAAAQAALDAGLAGNEPWNKFGNDNRDRLEHLIKNPGAFSNNPAYLAALKESNSSIEHSAAARGTLLSGGTLKDIGSNTANVFDQKYNQYLNQLSGFASFGERATARNQGLQGVFAGNIIDNGRFATNIITGANQSIGNANAGYYGDQQQAIEDIGTAGINAGATLIGAGVGAPRPQTTTTPPSEKPPEKKQS